MNIQITGDPFIDTGRLAAQTIFKHLKLMGARDDWLKIIDWAADKYQNKWNSSIDSISLNGPVTHNTKRKTARKEAFEFFSKVFSGTNPYKGESLEGFCRGCGQRQRLFGAGRDMFPLSGSGAFLNFHHGYEGGLFLCAQCMASLFLVPFAVIQCGKNIALLQTQTKALQEFWKRNTVEQNVKDLTVGKSESILKSSCSNVQNAFFDLVNDLITEWYSSQKSFEPQDLRLFYFTNFGANPESEIFDLPAATFSFLWMVQNPNYPQIKSGWHYFVRRHFRIRDANFDETTQSWQKSKGKNKGEMQNEDYKNNPNTLYQMLLSERNILPRMYRSKDSKTLVPIEIAKAYCLEVRSMKKERIEVVLDLADRVCELVRKENAPKLIYSIESARYVYQFRAGLLKLLKKNIKVGEPQPLFTTEDYIHKLLPDGEPWTDVRDLMLIRIYEKLHDFLQGEREEISEDTIAVPVEE